MFWKRKRPAPLVTGSGLGVGNCSAALSNSEHSETSQGSQGRSLGDDRRPMPDSERSQVSQAIRNINRIHQKFVDEVPRAVSRAEYRALLIGYLEAMAINRAEHVFLLVAPELWRTSIREEIELYARMFFECIEQTKLTSLKARGLGHGMSPEEQRVLGEAYRRAFDARLKFLIVCGHRLGAEA